MTSELMTLTEASDALRLKPATLRAWRLQRRVLPFVKIGKKVFVRRCDVDSLILANLIPPQTLAKRQQ